MYISKFQVGNYKSHFNSAEFNFVQGFNLITGQNNAGKTALLEAISLGFGIKPHRSLKTLPTVTSPLDQRSWVNISFKVKRDELLEILLIPETEFNLPLPAFPTEFSKSIEYQDNDGTSATNLKDWFLSQEEYIYSLRFEKASSRGEKWIIPSLPSFGLYEEQNANESSKSFSRWRVNSDKAISFNGFKGTGAEAEVGVRVASALQGRIYIFRAERFNAGTCAFGVNPTLQPNAQNLPEVLNILQGNRQRFERFNNLVHQILPQIQWVSVRPFNTNTTSTSMLEIVVWPHDPTTEREDLAVPLNESGTGIGQVLAILYVALNSDSPRTIIIDEPQSFLHRGASRKLVEILRTQQRHQHQYIVSTHSPTIISAANPLTITILRQQEGETISETLNVDEIKQQQQYLAEVGAKPSDVFGYDSILWVEGETEEICFPMILERVAKSTLMGTTIRRVKHTGDFETKDANLIFDIYDRLSHGKSLLPPAIRFIFDDECRTTQQKTEMERRGRNKVTFLPRRMYENYLLEPSAIAATINKAIVANVEDYAGALITEDEVKKLLEVKVADVRYYSSAEGKARQEDWVKYIHAGKVLEDIFRELSRDKAPITFDKLIHSVALTEWMIDHTPINLEEIANLIKDVIDNTSVE
jgi:AAA15 family ATPase/GTPase